jgi:hypothetical protein
MASSSRDRISVDLGGLKATLFERARTVGVTPSGLVRDALAASLQEAGVARLAAHSVPPLGEGLALTRLSMRVTSDQAQAIADGARAAGMPIGAFVSGLVAGVPSLTDGRSRRDLIVALTESNAELASLSRNLNHLGSLIRQGAWRAADEYRPVMDALSRDLHSHLGLATRALADLQPARRTCVRPRQPT